MSVRLVATVLALTLAAGSAGGPQAATPAECVIIGPRDGGSPSISDAKECALASAPASTFKIPHALIALQTGVIAADTEVPWDGTKYDSPLWQRPHTVTSAIQWSALPFFQRTAGLIGRDRMRQGLKDLAYAADDVEGEIRTFWLTGDLAVTPLEQYAFLQRFFAGRLSVDAAHVATVRQALEMPPGEVTNASGRHPFV